MKVGIQSPYLDTLGGGERYILTIAEYFLSRGDEVDILWDGKTSVSTMASRFNLQLQGTNVVKNFFAPGTSIIRKFLESQKYDLMVLLSDGSIPLSFAKKNWLHLQVPFQKSNRPKIFNQLKFFCYSKIICNSEFTKKIIDQTYGIKSTVVYPPVDVKEFKPLKKEKIILSVGRFFAPKHLHNFAPKKQKEMITVFKGMVSGGLKNWKLVLLGSSDPLQSELLEELRREAKGYPIVIESNVNWEVMKESFAKATIYWHAAGFGEDLALHPERAEHFGITTVEAMSAGCVPVVFAGGGQKEIVEENKSGFFWATLDELKNRTLRIIKDLHLQKSIAKAAQEKSQTYSKEKFYDQLAEIIQ